MSAQSKTKIMIGNIDESGWLKALLSMGFNPNRCIGEFIGNSIDAHATDIKIVIDGKTGFIVDNGTGMNKDSLSNMFAVYRSHGHTHRIGNYGFGAKAAFGNLGKNGITRVITKSVDGPILTATADWVKMNAEGKYSGNITIDDSDVIEKEIYNKYLPESSSGTIMMFPVDVDIIEAIQTQFGIKSVKSDPIKACDMWSVIFGKFPVKISYISNGKPEKDLAMYNPMKSDQIDREISHYAIRYYKHNENGHKRFVITKLDSADNKVKDYEVVSSEATNRCEKKITPVRRSLDDYELIGEMDLDVYKLKVSGQISGANIMSDYDRRVLGDICDDDDIMFDFVPNVKLIRNKNFIGCVPITKKAARGGGKTRFDMLIHSEISTKPISTQDDPLDELFGVQTNKNQLNSGPPKQLTRLVEILKDEFSKELMRQTPDAIKPKPPKKAKFDLIVDGDDNGSDDDNSSIASTSTSSSNSNVKVGGGSSATELLAERTNSLPADNVVDNRLDAIFDVMDAQMDPVNESENVVISIVDNDAAVGGVGSDIRSFFGGGSAAGKPSKRIDVPGHRKGLVTGEELDDGWNSLNINKDKKYDDPDYIALFNLIQKIKNKD
jgi:hypothetical protein